MHLYNFMHPPADLSNLVHKHGSDQQAGPD